MRGGGGRGEWKNDFWAIFFAAIIGLQIFFLCMCRENFFIVIFFSEGEGGGGVLKLGLYA